MKLYMQMIQSSAAFLLVAVALLLVSCEKSEDIKDSYPASGDGLCMLLPPSIIVEPFGGGSASTRAASAIKEERQQFNVGEELGNIITLGNGETDTEEIAQTRANIASGIFYRIVIYTAAEYSGSLKITEQRLCKAGSTSYFGDAGDSTEPIYLYPGAYKIFCYSFNNATAIAKLSDGDLTIALKDDDDFMSTNILDKTITNANLGNNVNLGDITLYHRCCKLTGNLTAEGFDNSNITGTPTLSISGTFSQSGTWSITGSSFSRLSTFDSKTIPLSGSGTSRSGSVIMLPFPSTALKTTYSFKPTDAKVTVAKSDATLSSGQAFISGQSYAFTIKAIGAYVLTETGPVQIGNYKWATANLDGQTGKIESQPWVSGPLTGGGIPSATGNTTANSANNDWWRWEVATVDVSSAYSDNPSNEWASSKDPCTQKLGAPWKVPTKDYFDNLIGYKLASKKVYINGETITTTATGWMQGNNTPGCVFFDPDLGTCIFLPAAGRRRGSSYDSVCANGFYWSATLYASDTDRAYALNFYSDDCYVYNNLRYHAYSLRCAQ